MAQVSFAEAIAREKSVGLPDEARACSAAMSKWIDANRESKAVKGRKAPARNARGRAAPGKKVQAKMPQKRKSTSAAEEAVESGSVGTEIQKRTRRCGFPTARRQSWGFP